MYATPPHQLHDTSQPTAESPDVRPRGDAVVAGIALACCLSVAFAILNPVLLLLLVAPLALVTIRRSLGPVWLSPTVIVVGLITAVGFLGYLFYDGKAPTNNPLFVLSHANAMKTVLIIAVSTTAIVAGAYPFLRFRPRVEHVSARMVADRRGRIALCTLAGGSLLLALANIGELWSRPLYITASAGSLSGALPLSTIFALAALGYLAATTAGGTRVIVVAAIAIEFAVLFATGSRDFALGPITLAAGLHIGAGTRHTRIFLIASILVALLLLPVPLYMRRQPSHGLVAYWHALATMPYSVGVIKSALANLVFGFPVIGITGTETTQISPHDLLVSLNPAPGHLAGWYKISQRLRIGKNFPYAGLGEAWSVGPAYTIVIFGAVGAWLGYLERRISTLLARRQRMFVLPLLGLCGLFALLVASYNLRNATRPLWYSVALSVLLAVVQAIRNPRSQHDGTYRSPRPTVDVKEAASPP